MKLTNPQDIHDAKRFLKFFESIPKEQWCVGFMDGPYGTHCALGHVRKGRLWSSELHILEKMFRAAFTKQSSTGAINDGTDWPSEIGPMPDHPKDRIVTALKYMIGENL